MEYLINNVEPSETNKLNHTILDYACLGNDILAVDYAVRKLNLSFDELNIKMLKIINELRIDNRFIISPEIDNYIKWYSFKNKSLKNLCLYNLFSNREKIIFEQNPDNETYRLNTNLGSYVLNDDVEASSVSGIIENNLLAEFACISPK